jgi:hypothetical protein
VRKVFKGGVYYIINGRMAVYVRYRLSGLPNYQRIWDLIWGYQRKRGAYRRDGVLAVWRGEIRLPRDGVRIVGRGRVVLSEDLFRRLRDLLDRAGVRYEWRVV